MKLNNVAIADPPPPTKTTITTTINQIEIHLCPALQADHRTTPTLATTLTHRPTWYIAHLDKLKQQQKLRTDESAYYSQLPDQDSRRARVASQVLGDLVLYLTEITSIVAATKTRCSSGYIQQYINLLEIMIKSLIPLQIYSTPQQPQEKQKEVKEKTIKQSPVKAKTQAKKQISTINKGQLQLRFKVGYLPLPKQQQDQLYRLMMQLRHGRKELHLQCYKRIQGIVKYWGQHSYRFRDQLITQLQQQALNDKNYHWIIISILAAIVRGLQINHNKIQSQHNQLLELNNTSRPLKNIPTQQAIVKINQKIFTNIYSTQLLNLIITQPSTINKATITAFFLDFTYQFSPKYFVYALQQHLRSQSSVDYPAINKQLQYYSQRFPQVNPKIADVINNTPDIINNTPDIINNTRKDILTTHFAPLQQYLQVSHKRKSIQHLSIFSEDWHLGQNLHRTPQIISRLSQGVQGIALHPQKHKILFIYIQSLLTLAVAVQKQDPLMPHYPTMKDIVLKVAQLNDTSVGLYQQLLSAINSHQHLGYGNRKFVVSQLAAMVVSEQNCFKRLFEISFNRQQSLQCWLQIVKRLVLGFNFKQFDQYAGIMHCLSYHSSKQIKANSSFLLQKISSNGSRLVLGCRLFSISHQQRQRVAKQLFKQTHTQVLGQISQPLAKSNKKLLKISAQTIQNYMGIIFNPSLQETVRNSGASQLLQSLQRIQLNQTLVRLLEVLGQHVKTILKQSKQIQNSFLDVLVQINGLLYGLLPWTGKLSVEQICVILSRKLSSKSVRMTLQQLYQQCLGNPFSNNRQKHFTCNLYPHMSQTNLTITPLPLSQPQKVNNITTKQSSFAQYKNSLQFQPFVQHAIFSLANSYPLKLDNLFIQIFQKQIGQILHAQKGYLALNFLAYAMQLLNSYNVVFPQKITDYASPLLNNLLLKDQTYLNLQPTALILANIGLKPTRNIYNVIIGSPGVTWKYPLLMRMPIYQQITQSVVKGLLGISYGRQATQICQVIMMHIDSLQLNTFSRGVVYSSMVKFIRQDTDPLLRNAALCLLTQLYSSNQYSIQQEGDLFSSLSALLMQQSLSTQSAVLAINLLRLSLRTHNNQGNVPKIITQKLVSVLLNHSSNPLLPASILQFINSLLSSESKDLLPNIQLVDTCLNHISIVEKKTQLSFAQSKLVQVSMNFILLWADHEQDINKYLLTSTRFLSHLLLALQITVPEHVCGSVLEAVGRCWLALATSDQDLFVYKLNQLMKNSTRPLIDQLVGRASQAGQDYLKAIAWTLIIWVKNRQEISPQTSQQLAQQILKGPNSSLIKWLLPFSIEAKIIFLNSPYFQERLKQMNSIVDSRIVKDAKDKKKKAKVFVLQQNDHQTLIKGLALLCSLFYWGQSSQGDCNQGGQSLRKILGFVQKTFNSGQWQQPISKSLIKLVANMSKSPFANFCAVRLSQSAILIEQIMSQITKSQSQSSPKIALKMLGVLIHLQPLRMMVMRNRLIQDLCTRLSKSQQKGDLNLQYTMDVVQLFLAISPYKDANLRMLTDKKILQVLVRILKLGKFSILQEKIVTLLGNLACFKHNKPIFMSNRDIHKTILGLLQDPDITYHSQLLTLLYNLIYKNSAGLKLYRRAEVIQLVRRVGGKIGSQVVGGILEALESKEQA